MKKRISKITLILAIAVIMIALCACGGGTHSEAAYNAENSTDSPDNAVNMSIVTASGTMQQRELCRLGCYEIYKHIDGHGKLFFYDFEKRTISFVTDKEYAADDESNPGWIEDTLGGATPVVAGDSLYVFKLGSFAMPFDDFDGYETYLIKMDFDGKNRKEIHLGSLQEFDMGQVAFDGSYLYFIVDVHGTEPGVMENYLLCRANFDTMQLETLCELGTDNHYSLVSVYENGLVFQRFVAVGTEPNEYNSMSTVYKSEIVLYSLSDNRFVDTDLTWQNGSLSCVFDKKGNMYYLADGSTRLCVRDLDSGKTSVVCDDVNTDGLEVESAYIEGRIFDNHIPFYVSTVINKDGETQEEHFGYYYDLDTGKIGTVSFDKLDWLENTGIYIIDETESEFFVHLGYKYVSTTKQSENDSSYSFEEQIHEYAMISKEDYWNSVPNFELFEDNVHST